jgi:polar amino acid transport system ATP-binding protein
MTGLMVEAQQVHKSFGPIEVLRGIDFQVAPGQVVCLLGPSGSGKSTFLRCINHLEKINAGRLFVDGELVGYRETGERLYELSEKAIAKKRTEIGMVFQHFNLFPHMTAMGNIIEAPCQVKNCLPRSAWPTRPTPIRANSREGSNNGWRSRGRSRCDPS